MAKKTEPPVEETTRPVSKRSNKDEAKEEKKPSLMERMLALNKSIRATVAATDPMLLKETFHNTGMPAFNIAASGDVYGGLPCGVTLVAGPSKHFKSLFCLHAAAQFQRDNPDGLVAFYNNEFGVNAGYMAKAGIDLSRVIHCPFLTIEQLRADQFQRAKEITPDDKIMFLTDSIGAGATERELANAHDEDKQDDDRARAKAIKSLFRMVGPALNIKGIVSLYVGHTRKEGDPGYEKTIVGGGQGPYYFADNIFVVSRKPIKTKVKTKEGDAQVAADYNSNEFEYNITEGYKFLLHIEKGRFTQEDRVLVIEVRWNHGVCHWSGFDDMAEGFGIVDFRRGKNNQTWVHFPSQALIASDPDRYGSMPIIKSPIVEQVDEKTGEVIVDVAIDTPFWRTVLDNSDFASKIHTLYRK